MKRVFAVLLALLAIIGDAVAADCASGEFPWQVQVGSEVFKGNTGLLACKGMFAAFGGALNGSQMAPYQEGGVCSIMYGATGVTYSSQSVHNCTQPAATADNNIYFQCTTDCRIKMEFPQMELTSQRVQDYMSLWGMFLVACVLILCLKSVYNRFRLDYGY